MLGLVDGAIGPIWPDLRDDLGRTDSAFGWIIAGLATGYFVTTIGSGHIATRLGVTTTLRAALAMSVGALLLVAISPGWSVLLAGFVLLGLGNGLVDATANAWVATTAGPRELGLVHGFYGLGAFGGPLVATVFVAGGDRWRAPFVVFLMLQVGVGVAIASRGHGFDHARETAVAAVARTAPRRAPQTLMLLLAWFGLYVGVEVSIGWWSYTMLTEARGVGDVAAGLLVATFWVGLTIGRFGLAAVGDRLPPERIMSQAAGVAVVTVGLLWLDPGELGALALLPTGIALGVMFPIAINRTAVYLGEERAAHAVGYQLAASSIGGIALPAGIGALADHHGAGAMVPVAFAATAVTAALWAAVWAVQTGVVSEPA